MSRRERASKREIFGWAMFDFANSSYTTVIITVVFSVVFPRLIVEDLRLGNLYWSIALSISYFLTFLLAPFFGAIMDATATKKQFLFASYLVTVISTALLWLVEPGMIWFGLLLVILSNFGFSIGESFVSAFLPELGPPEDLGKISGFAWALGYFGGLSSTAIILFGLGELVPENFAALRWIGPITALFFAVAAIPTFLLLKDRGVARPLPTGVSYFREGVRQLNGTVKNIREFRDLALFLLSLFFAMAGLSIIIAFAFIYGDQVVGWSSGTQMTMFILTQLTAASGALLFGFVQDKIGARFTYNLTLGLWVVTVLLIYFVADLTALYNSTFGTTLAVEHLFLVVGVTAGSALGATQSASRALVGLFTPQSREGEFFGFWGNAGRLASILGILSVGILQTLFGLQQAILLCALFFLLGIVVALFVDEKRGRQRAELP